LRKNTNRIKCGTKKVGEIIKEDDLGYHIFLEEKKKTQPKQKQNNNSKSLLAAKIQLIICCSVPASTGETAGMEGPADHSNSAQLSGAYCPMHSRPLMLGHRQQIHI